MLSDASERARRAAARMYAGAEERQARSVYYLLIEQMPNPSGPRRWCARWEGMVILPDYR